jgi:hypothetical protein
MSYDLMVFDLFTAPSRHPQFMEWYFKQIEWTEEHDYSSPSITTADLGAWFAEIIEIFPPMNGPLSLEDLLEDEASLTDYSVGRTVIYGAFAWSKADQAYSSVFRLAAKHGVGFFDVSSSDEEVWLPEKGTLALAHSR